MKVFVKIVLTGIVLVWVVLMSGCTPEKAQALLTTIKSFESKSIQAINSYEQLFKEYRTLKKKSKEEIFTQTSQAILMPGGANSVTVERLAEKLSSIKEKNQLADLQKEFYEIKSVYSAIRSAYASLPQGSMLGAQYVSCGQNIVAKATNQLVNFAMNINDSPLYPMALKEEVAKYRALVKAKKENESKIVFNEIAVAFSQYDEKHEDALKLTLIAVEEGRRVHDLLADYNTITVSQIISVLNFSFSFINSLEGIDVSDVITEMETIQKEMDASEEWKRIKEIPLTEVVKCALET